MQIKLGSLFDGSGGFPLAGALFDIEPVWASEIEPFPIRVTKLRFPNMKHLGSVTEVHGDQIEPVDIITFGSPCQDLSIAGKQAGIHDGERSNLFFQAIRIIKEMRDVSANRYPRFAVWENVPGAFSSNQGRDFQAVLQAFCDIENCGLDVVPQPKKWNHSGCIVGDGYSIAWRLYDAQFWGVPQRRKRIYLIADFAGERAGEILFEQESMQGNIGQGRTPWKDTPCTAKGSTTRSDRVKCLNPWDPQEYRQVSADGAHPSLQAHQGGRYAGVVYCLQGNGIDRAETAGCNGKGWCENVSYTLNTIDRPAVALSIGNGQLHQMGMEKIARPLDCMHDQQAIITDAKPPRKYVVRRLTPTECGRLQGFPDWWVDGANGSDSAIYKMWGNGIALPCAADVIGRLAKTIKEEETEYPETKQS